MEIALAAALYHASCLSRDRRHFLAEGGLNWRKTATCSNSSGDKKRKRTTRFFPMFIARRKGVESGKRVELSPETMIERRVVWFIRIIFKFVIVTIDGMIVIDDCF